jgi:hypothetical protein
MAVLRQDIEIDVICAECGATLSAYFNEQNQLEVETCGCKTRIIEELWDDNATLSSEVERLKENCLILDTGDEV